MRRVIVSNYVTLDGFMSGPNDETDWFRWNEETERYAKELMQSVDTILFGRVTFELMAAYWPTPASEEEDPDIRAFMNNSRKIVFSRRLVGVEWNNTSIIPEISREAVQELKNQPGKDMVIYGSGNVIGKLLDLGLIDEFRMFVNPIILGIGKPMFGSNTERHDLMFTETQAFSNGVVLLRYLPGKSEPSSAAGSS